MLCPVVACSEVQILRYRTSECFFQVIVFLLLSHFCVPAGMVEFKRLMLLLLQVFVRLIFIVYSCKLFVRTFT